jgi:hypothetical protein
MTYLECTHPIENKLSTEIGALLTLSVGALKEALRRRRRFNVGRVLVLKTPRGGGGEDSMSAECSFSITPVEEEEEIQRR